MPLIDLQLPREQIVSKMVKDDAFSDNEEAFDLIKSIGDDESCRNACYKRGSGWSDIFNAVATMYTFFFFNMICVGFGAYNAVARLIGRLSGVCLCLFSIAMIITTGVLRLN